MASTVAYALNASAVNEHTHQAQCANDVQLADDTFDASADGSWLDVGEGRNLVLTRTVADSDGTLPTFDVALWTSADKGVADSPRLMGAFSQATADGAERKSFPCSDRYVRVTVILGGTTPAAAITVAGKVC